MQCECEKGHRSENRLKNSREKTFYGIENVHCIALCTWVADRLWLYFKLVVRTPYIFTLQLKRLICPMQPWKLLGFWLHQIIANLNRVCECSGSGESTFLDSIQLNCNEICLHLGVFGYLWTSAVHWTYTLHYALQVESIDISLQCAFKTAHGHFNQCTLTMLHESIPVMFSGLSGKR